MQEKLNKQNISVPDNFPVFNCKNKQNKGKNYPYNGGKFIAQTAKVTKV